MLPGRLESKRQQGYSIAELPAGLILLFIGIFIPLMILASISYRVSLLYFATRDSCIRAAKAPTFTAAQLKAQTTLARDIAAFSELAGSETIQIMTKPLSGGSATFSSVRLPPNSVDTNNNIYFIKETVNGTVAPLVTMKPSYFGSSIPGLTASFNVQMTFEAYVENPNGLTQ